MVGTAHQESTITEGGKTVKISTDITVTTEGSPDGSLPKANAGNDFTANIMEGQPSIVIELDGSKSTGTITKQLWSQYSGPHVSINDDSKLITSFIASELGFYNFILAVGDNSGHASTDSLTITVTKAGRPPPPPNDKDPGLPPKPWLEQPEKGGNKDPTTWKVVAMTKDPKLSKVVDDKNINISVEFSTAAYAQQYIDHFVWLKNNPPPPPVPVTKAIITNATQSVKAGSEVNLDGSKSTTATPAQPLIYEWSQSEGPNIIISNADKSIAKIQTHSDVDIDYGFMLRVLDAAQKPSYATATIISKVNPPPPPPPPPSGTKDIEGIQMLYADDVSKAAQQFFLSRDGPNNSRVSGKGARKLNSDGTVTITPDPGTSPASARIYIGTTNPKFQDINTQLINGKDWNKMINLPDKDGIKRGGWMEDWFDWRDVELTHYYRIPKINTDDEMTQYLGGNHPSGGFPGQCVSSCYKAQIQTKDCTSRSALEWDHYNSPSNYAWWDGKKDAFDLKAALGGTMANKLIGQKWVRYNEIGANDGLLKAVHMELYVDLESKDLPKPDLTKQKWQFLNEWVHDGTNWPTKPADNLRESACNAKGITMPAWGASILAIRFDASPWTLYNLSARPIIPKKSVGVE